MSLAFRYWYIFFNVTYLVIQVDSCSNKILINLYSLWDSRLSSFSIYTSHFLSAEKFHITLWNSGAAKVAGLLSHLRHKSLFLHMQFKSYLQIQLTHTHTHKIPSGVRPKKCCFRFTHHLTAFLSLGQIKSEGVWCDFQVFQCEKTLSRIRCWVKKQRTGI